MFPCERSLEQPNLRQIFVDELQFCFCGIPHFFTDEGAQQFNGEQHRNVRVEEGVAVYADGEQLCGCLLYTSVGSMGIFAATVGLEMGYNYVTLTADKAGYDEAYYTVVIKRLPNQLKKDLQNMIALPGLY